MMEAEKFLDVVLVDENELGPVAEKAAADVEEWGASAGLG